MDVSVLAASLGELAVSEGWITTRPVMATVVCLVLAKSLTSMREATLLAHRSWFDASRLLRRSVDEHANVAEVRHDAVNSLAAIRAALWMLCDQQGSQAPQELRSALERELDHLEHLILRDGGREVDFEVDDLVRDAALLYRVQGVDVQVQAQPTTAHGRPDDVRRAVENLLANAQRHGAGPVRIEVRKASDGVEVAVSDDGPGVPEALVARLFDRRASADPARGSGLGLHVSRRLIRQQLGDLSLRPRERGSTFELRLPPASSSGAAGGTKAAEPERP